MGTLAELVETSAAPRDALEAMLCDQLAGCHNAAIRLLQQASMFPYPETVVKLVGAAARMCTTFQSGLEVLGRLRNGNQHTMVVQHVQIGSGAQAIVAGNVERNAGTGGERE